MFPKSRQSACMASALLLGICHSEAALSFNFTSTGNAQADAGFAAAGARWSGLFTDNITVNINAGFSALGAGILGSAASAQGTISYSAVRSALLADKTSASDNTATSNLQAAPALRLEMNYTSNSPHGSGSATPYLDNDGDANNTTIRLTSANAKALGLLAGNAAGTDANISFSTAFTWDFNPGDGITAGAFDFVGVAAHEIGHSLGFISGVDVLDGNSSGPFFADDQFTYVSTLDLYRYSTLSFANGALDWTADNRTKYFSIDGGVTSLATFSTGVTHGDGRQASHWKDSLGLGLLDPTAAMGELLSISANDILAFDVIGFDLAAVPEPASFGMVAGLALLGIGAGGRMRRARHAGMTPVL